MYRSSGGGWGIIIGMVIGAIIIFLITREFWCWYWKINKGVKLLEQQNQLLKQLLVHLGVPGISIVESSKPAEEQISSRKNEENVQSNELKIIRLNSDAGSALLVNVKIDNEKEISLENGGAEIIKIPNGKHTIKATFNNDIAKMDFEINNNGKVFSIINEPPLKINEV